MGKFWGSRTTETRTLETNCLARQQEHKAQVFGNSLYVFGGYNGSIVLNDFHEFRFDPLFTPPSSLVEDLERAFLQRRDALGFTRNPVVNLVEEKMGGVTETRRYD